jgi:hypothetical protein
MIPEGGGLLRGSVNKEVAASFTLPGVYSITCAPQMGMGMMALEVVGGDVGNLEAVNAAKMPYKAQDHSASLFAKLLNRRMERR